MKASELRERAETFGSLDNTADWRERQDRAQSYEAGYRAALEDVKSQLPPRPSVIEACTIEDDDEKE